MHDGREPASQAQECTFYRLCVQQGSDTRAQLDVDGRLLRDAQSQRRRFPHVETKLPGSACNKVIEGARGSSCAGCSYKNLKLPAQCFKNPINTDATRWSMLQKKTKKHKTYSCSCVNKGFIKEMRSGGICMMRWHNYILWERQLAAVQLSYSEINSFGLMPSCEKALCPRKLLV